MRGAGWGRIVNVGSTTTIEINPALNLSNAHRMATVGFLKTLAREVAGDGITVNTVATGRFATDRMAELGGSMENVEAAARREVPGRPARHRRGVRRPRRLPLLRARRLHHRHRDPDRRRLVALHRLTAMKEWSNPERVAEYLSREIPTARRRRRCSCRRPPERVDRILDLGTGNGRLVSLLRSAHPEAEAIGLDSSEPMLARARERFDRDGRVEFRLHDLRDPLPRIGPFDAIVSGLAIHHLEDDRKRDLFAEVHGLLAPGGVFANLDLVRAPTAELHERFRREIGRPEATRPTASPTSAISSNGCARPASPTPTASSSGCS